jgi:putative ABC transport system ATP-binding protein
VRAVDGVDLQLHAGELVAIVGPSGSGKTTLLRLLAGLERPDAGSAWVEGRDLGTLSEPDLAELRRRRVGFVFQSFELLPTLRAWENVAVPALLDGKRLAAMRPHAVELLERVGLADRADFHPGQLSGGQQQRVALARALCNGPSIILADEPTGDLDTASGDVVIDILASLASDGRLVVMTTHDARAAARGARTITLVDGRIAAAELSAP